MPIVTKGGDTSVTKEPTAARSVVYRDVAYRKIVVRDAERAEHRPAGAPDVTRVASRAEHVELASVRQAAVRERPYAAPAGQSGKRPPTLEAIRAEYLAAARKPLYPSEPRAAKSGQATRVQLYEFGTSSSSAEILAAQDEEAANDAALAGIAKTELDIEGELAELAGLQIAYNDAGQWQLSSGGKRPTIDILLPLEDLLGSGGYRFASAAYKAIKAQAARHAPKKSTPLSPYQRLLFALIGVALALALGIHILRKRFAS